MATVSSVTLPAHWASALVNNDYSGLDADEADRCRKAADNLSAAGWTVVSTDDEPCFTWYYRLYDPNANCVGGEVLAYTVLRD